MKGLPWFASSGVINYIGSNLSIGATITHVLLWYGKDIIGVIRNYRVSFSYLFFSFHSRVRQNNRWLIGVIFFYFYYIHSGG